MGQQANITAFDGAATPVSHTFTGVGAGKDDTVGGYADWRELLTSVPTAAQPSIRMTKKALKNGLERVAIDVKIPVMESISGQNAAGYTAAPKVAFYDQVSFVGYFSERSATVNRRLARQLLINIVGGVTTTVASVNSTDAAGLVDSSVVPT